MRTKTYVINLKSSTDRREYMQEVLRPCDCLDVEFVEAVNGKEFSAQELEQNFDQKKAYEHYGRELRPGEIGCTLSHKKCARLLLESEQKYALFLEDDLIWQTDDLEPVMELCGKVLDTDKPTVVLLSGDYWYTCLKKTEYEYKLAIATDAVCTQSYLINRAGAEKLLSLGNWHLADDWWAIRHHGVRLRALFPHVTDQNRADVETVIAEAYGGLKRENLSMVHCLKTYWRSLADKVLAKINHFEGHNFKWKQ